MSKIEQAQAQLLWKKLKIQADLFSKSLEAEKVKLEKIKKVKVLSQKEKNEKLLESSEGTTVSYFEEALELGADMTYNSYGKPFYLTLFENVRDNHQFIEVLFKHGLKEKIRNPDEIWKTFFKENDYSLLPTFKLLIKNEILCSNMQIFERYKENFTVAHWWDHVGVWENPKQVSLLKPEKVIKSILDTNYSEYGVDFTMATLNKIKKVYPEEFKKLQSPQKAGELWLEAFYASDRNVELLCHLIKLEIIPPLRFKNNNKTQFPISWTWIALKISTEEVFEFLMKSQEMQTLFKEDLKNNPEDTALSCARRSLDFKKPLITLLKEEKFDFTITDKKRNNFFHHYLRSYKREINKELNDIVMENVSFFLKSKNTRHQTIFDLKGDENGEPLTVIVKRKKMTLSQYKILVEKSLLQKSLPVLENQSPSIKRARL